MKNTGVSTGTLQSGALLVNCIYEANHAFLWTGTANKDHFLLPCAIRDGQIFLDKHEKDTVHKRGENILLNVLKI